MTESRWTAVWLGVITGLAVVILLRPFPWLAAAAMVGLPVWWTWLSSALGTLDGER